MNNSVQGQGLECVKELDLNIWSIISYANVNNLDEDDESFTEAHDTILVPIEDLMRDSIENHVRRFSECYLHDYIDDRFDDYFK
ncbi:MAG: hypothetical protein ACK5DE_02850 [Bacteroidota bacterium]